MPSASKPGFLAPEPSALNSRPKTLNLKPEGLRELQAPHPELLNPKFVFGTFGQGPEAAEGESFSPIRSAAGQKLSGA